MKDYLNRKRPPLYCPGCSHGKVVHGLNAALQRLGLPRERVVIVTDIGCSGLFDTFFDTHAFHGLHGRALTYATGMKMVRPELLVIVVMGDGGLGIGGAHFLAACRRNLDLTLLILNNFNYGMTGGQCSVSTPKEAQTSSGFLNQLEEPLDLCQVAIAAGCCYVHRAMSTDKELSEKIAAALEYQGFSVMDLWGICSGRYLKANPLTLQQLEKRMRESNTFGEEVDGLFTLKDRAEYGTQYRQAAAATGKREVHPVEIVYAPLLITRCEVLLLGGAGQYINTTGEILCYAAMSCGLHVTQKSDYPITVLRGHSVSEVVVDREPIEYTGLFLPDIVVCLAPEGVERRQEIFEKLKKSALIIRGGGVQLPPTKAKVVDLALSGKKIQSSWKGLAALALLAKTQTLINAEMLKMGIGACYDGKRYLEAIRVVDSYLGESSGEPDSIIPKGLS